ncbi:MAG: winged helix-turn-helix domain-containing protein [Candidatus Thorarchaeota archaeon]
MTSGDEKLPIDEESLTEADLFEAISHETRIHALFALEEGPVGFADFKRELGISSSGNLQHHIRKLGELIHTNAAGEYKLTEQGKEALIAISMIRNMERHMKSTIGVVTIIGAFAYYVVQMNLPFIMGTVNPMTPVFALLSTGIFGVIFYGLWTIVSKVTSKKGFANS